MAAFNHRTVEKLEAITLRGEPATRVHYLYAFLDEEPRQDTAVYVDGCSYCQRERTVHATFFPSHFASARCQSGQRNHCTCSICF